MEQEIDFFSTYRAVSNKLKKRFMKKPNVAEARDEFGQLVKSLNAIGSSHYAGFCCLAMARCEQNMLNSSGEIQALIESARCFLQADKSLEGIHCPNCGEHLNSAKHGFELAIKNYVSTDLPIMAARLCEEIGSYLQKHKMCNEALTYYQRAAELYFQNPLLSIQAQLKVVQLKVLLSDHQGALVTCSDCLHQILEKGTYHNDGVTLLGKYAELDCECEVTIVLLLMLLDIHPLKMKSTYSKVLQKYTWTDKECDATSSVCNGMDKELFVLLQSVVMSCSSKDLISLKYLCEELKTYLTSQQYVLLHKVIDELYHPTGLGF